MLPRLAAFTVLLHFFLALQLPEARFMRGLIRLHCAWGIRYIIGLPLFMKAPEQALHMKNYIDGWFRDYPFAIVSYELGNEPDQWPTKAGGFQRIQSPVVCTPVQMNTPAYQLVGTMDTPSDRYNPGYALYREGAEPYLPYKPQSYCFQNTTEVFATGVDNYNAYFKRSAEGITGCGGLTQEYQVTWGWPYWGPPGFNRRMMSGPAWSSFSADINAFKSFLLNSQQ
jgi:hypothetical protein